MGIHSMIVNKKKTHRASKGKRGKRIQKQERKKQTTKSVMVEGAEFLSKEQLKNVIRHPGNNLRPSGKRKQKVLKRLRHSRKEKSAMEVAAEPTASTSQVKSKPKKEKPAQMDTDSSDDDVLIMDETILID